MPVIAVTRRGDAPSEPEPEVMARGTRKQIVINLFAATRQLIYTSFVI